MTTAIDRLAATPVGFWAAQFDDLPWRDVAPVARKVDDLGLGSIWFRESGGREAMSQAALLLDATDRVVVASGIATVWARDAVAMRNGARTLSDAHPGRFVCGIGVSHPASAAQRGAHYERPLATMAAYLDAFDAAESTAALDVETPTVLAALGPRMLDLAARRTDGVHTTCVPVAHTAEARAALSDGALVVGQAAVVSRSAADADAVARRYLARFFGRDNYRRNLHRFGITDAAMDDPIDDALVDQLVAIGGVDALAARIQAHLDAGATHVAVHLLGDDGTPAAVADALDTLAQAAERVP
ncbi:MAG: TIGR03620 family F420-dependent LLM class oxidoreductase [Nitriliruptoraceae bacterium]